MIAVVNGYGRHKHDLTHQQLLNSLRVSHQSSIENVPLEGVTISIVVLLRTNLLQTGPRPQ